MIDIKNIATTVLIFAIGIVVLSIMLQVMGESKDNLKTTITTSVANETVSAIINATNSSLANGKVVNSSIFVINSSNNEKLGVENYTLNPTLGTIRWNFDNETIIGFNNSNVKVSYDYTGIKMDAAYNISVKGEQGGVKIGQWLPTIGLVIGAIFIITTIGLLFMKKRE